MGPQSIAKRGSDVAWVAIFLDAKKLNTFPDISGNPFRFKIAKGHNERIAMSETKSNCDDIKSKMNRIYHVMMSKCLRDKHDFPEMQCGQWSIFHLYGLNNENTDYGKLKMKWVSKCQRKKN